MNGFKHTIPLGRAFGIPVDLDFSWFLIFGLLTWMLAVGYFPVRFPGWSATEYWVIAAIAAVMLFVCVLLHEFGHSLVAMRYKISVGRITLFIFGGVSQITAEPPSASAEFWIAIAGPIVSFALAFLCYEARFLFPGGTPLWALTEYLALLNFILGLFNLVPGFPLDGGRVMRAIVWGATRNFQRATSIAANTGRFVGFAMIFWGLLMMLGGNLINGIWLAFIGWFLESAAAAQIQQTMVKGLLVGHRVSDVMNREFTLIPAETTIQELVEKHVLKEGRRSFLVGRNGQPAGLLTLGGVRQVPRPQWPTTTAEQSMIPLDQVITIPAGAELWTALEKMGRSGVNQIPVVDNGTVIGLLSREDVVEYMHLLRQLSG
ncbi:MAG TPA: site-2 protease family protein [Candidatus Dormibacteraeota bacterium]|nr:site-2 protease family protein [Candidatus Dormibacteraeota bacterium]